MAITWPFSLRSTLESERDSAARLTGEIAQLKSRLQRTEAERDLLRSGKLQSDQAELDRGKAARRQAFLDEWASLERCELPHLELPGYSPFAKRTFDGAQYLLEAPTSAMWPMLDPERYKNRATWAFYWLMTNAARDAQAKALDGTIENAITTAFSTALKDWGHKYAQEFGNAAGIGLSTALLFEHLKGNLQEADTGADMVMVVSGRDLVGNDGARLIWVQAKRQGAVGDPLRLAYGQKNARHGTQCAALQRLNREGSIGLYVLYSNRLPLVAAAYAAPLNPAGESVSLANEGARLQELITATAQSKSIGQFGSPQEVLSFLESVAKGDGLPLQVVAVESGEGTFRDRLVSLIKSRNREMKPPSRGHGRG